MKTVLRNGIPIGLFVATVMSASALAQAQTAPDLFRPKIIVIDAPGAGKGPGDPSCDARRSSSRRTVTFKRS
jgi:hypothetical protein